MCELMTNRVERENIYRQEDDIKKKSLKGQMIDDHVERKMISNENDSWTMSSLQFNTIKNDTKDSHLLNFLFQNAFTGNATIDIYGVGDAFV